MVLFFGHKKQTVEVAEIRVIRYDAGFDAAKLPRLRRSYEGRAPDAPWRQEALARIETQRKKDLSLTLTGAGGNPLANTPVRVRLRRHEFGFGSAVPAALLTADSEDGRRFRDIVDRYFSIVVFENDLKDFYWNASVPADQKARHKQTLDQAFAWLAERHIKVRGHYLLQVAEYDTMKTQPSGEIRAMVLDTARERIAYAGERVCEWDAINHPVAWGGARLLTRRPGMEHFDHEVLALARSLSPLPMFVNEDQLFRPGPQADGTFEYLQKLKDQGIRIDGLGNQAHMHESYLPSPPEILAITDRFAALAPRQAVTEFDLQTERDEQLAADYTRDLLITCFSHPAYQSFLWWGFWEGSHWLPATASWNKDWSIRQRGQVIEEWLGKRWRTEAELTTNARGEIRWRGFPGRYEAVIDGTTVPFLASSASPAAVASMPAP
jgi:GH35 family endo-1,4-beta-xylanase